MPNIQIELFYSDEIHYATKKLIELVNSKKYFAMDITHLDEDGRDLVFAWSEKKFTQKQAKEAFASL